MFLAVLSSVAWAQEAPAAETPVDDDLGDTVFVYQPDGTPRVAGAASYIGEKELETHEYDDIGRVLSQTPGIYVRGEDGFGLRPNIGLRGANSDRSAKITLLEDGIPLVPAPYAAPAAYYFPMATRMTGIEVFKGAAATQHGPQTIGGAVNLITRAVPTKTSGAADLAYGQRNTAKLHAWGALANERAGVLLEASHLQTDGFKRLGDGEPTGFDRTDLMLKGRLTGTTARGTFHNLELKLGYGSEKSHETYLGLHPDDYAVDPYLRYPASSLGLMRWKRSQAELAWTVKAKGIRVRTVGYHHFITRQWTKFNRFAEGPSIHSLLQEPQGGSSSLLLDILRGDADSDPTDAGQLLEIGTNDRRYHAFGVQSNLRWTAPIGSKGQMSNRFEAGIRLHGDQVDRAATEAIHVMKAGQLVRTEAPETSSTDNLSSATALAVHVHDDLRLGGFHALPGARLEVVHTTYVDAGEEPTDPQTRATLLPGLALLQEVGSTVQVFGGVHRGFSPVGPGQASDVEPEVSWNYEAGARASDGQRHAELVGYLNDYTNLTGQCTLSGGCRDDQLDQQFNGGRVWVYGLEAAADWTFLLPGRLELRPSGTYTLTVSRFRTGFTSGFPQFGTVEIGDSLPYVPVHQGSAKLTVDHPRFGVSVGLSARSGMRDTAGRGPLTDRDVPGRALVDVAAHVTLDQHLRIYATLVNATNNRAVESWRPFGARPTAPTQAMVGIKVQ